MALPGSRLLPLLCRSGRKLPAAAFKAIRGGIGQDIRALPARDVYGNATDGEAYRDSLLFAGASVPLDLTRVTSGYQIGLASWNAADDAARRIRQDRDLGVTTFVMAYTANGAASADPPDMRLMHRLANADVPGNNAFDPQAPRGAVVSGGDLPALFTSMRAAIEAVRR